MAQVNKLNYTGVKDTKFSAYQTSGSFYSASGWSSYLICNFYDGSYYKQIFRFPFANGGNNIAPQYKRIENSVDRGWKNFLSDENFTSYVDNYISNH